MSHPSDECSAQVVLALKTIMLGMTSQPREEYEQFLTVLIGCANVDTLLCGIHAADLKNTKCLTCKDHNQVVVNLIRIRVY